MIERRNPSQNINHADVQSSSIRSIGYDKESQELHVTFNDTGRYVYYGVPPETHEALMMSGSKGNFLHHNVKSKHGFTKI